MANSRILRAVFRTLANRRAATVVEYGLICAFIALAIVGSLNSIAKPTTGALNHVSTEMVNSR